MGLPAARVGDPHLCPMFDGPKPHVGGPIMPLGAVPNVWIGGMMAATAGTMCVCASAPDSIMMGSPTVYIGGRMAARMLDPTVHGGRIIFGCMNVWIGDSGAPSALASFFIGLLDSLFDSLKSIVEPLMWFAEGVVQGFVSALMGTISGIVNLAKEILTDPLGVLERTANFLQKLMPTYWAAKLITDPQTRAEFGKWLSDHSKIETWEHYGDVARKAYDTWQQLTPKEKWTAAGDVTGRALEFAAEIALLDGATKAIGTAGEVAKGAGTAEEITAGLGKATETAGVGEVVSRELAHKPSWMPERVIQAKEGETTTVLGSYKADTESVLGELKTPKSENFGPREGDFNVLNVPDEKYVNPDQFWHEYNEPWLRSATDRGDEIVIMSNPRDPSLLTKSNGELTGFGREIEYMDKLVQEKKYEFVPQTGNYRPIKK